jgi:Brp/Blh family beta-carotene 15,15'-monooxygenase
MKHNQVLIVLSCILLALKVSGLWSEAWMDYMFFGLVMILIGLPHGAVDHLIHIRQKQSEELTAATLGRFLRSYLLMIALYGLVWYLLPAVSLALFIGLSCYHFGQSQLFYFFKEEGYFSALAYVLWGLAVLSYIICWNSQDSIALISSILPGFGQWLESSSLAANLWFLPWVLSIVPVVFLGSRLRGLPFSIILWEAGSLLAIGLVSYYGGLLVAFSVYFGFWHSSKSLRAIVRSFRSLYPNYTYTRFYKEALLFSAISLAGIGLLLAGTYYFPTGIHPVMLFFVLISLLTFPHMVILEEVYRKPKSL